MTGQASCAPLDLTKLPTGLRPAPVVVDGLNVPRCAALADADRFEEGQLSGPYGPQFAGWGPMPRPTLREQVRAVVEWAAVIAALSGAIMVAGVLR